MYRGLRCSILACVVIAGCSEDPRTVKVARHASDSGTDGTGAMHGDASMGDGTGGTGAGGTGAGGTGTGGDDTTPLELPTDGVIYYASGKGVPPEQQGVFKLDLGAGETTRLSEREYFEMSISKDKTHLALRERVTDVYEVISTSDGTVLASGEDFASVYDLLGWADDDHLIFHNALGDLMTCLYDGTDLVTLEPRPVPSDPAAVATGLSVSPDGTRIAAYKNNEHLDHPRIIILSMDGYGAGPLSTIEGGCGEAPMWMPSGKIFGVCGGHFYVASEGDAEVTWVDPGQEGQITSYTRWAGDDEILVEFMVVNDPDVRRLQLFDESGTYLHRVRWLNEVTGVARLYSMRFSTDRSTMLYTLTIPNFPSRIHLGEAATGRSVFVTEGELAQWSEAK